MKIQTQNKPIRKNLSKAVASTLLLMLMVCVITYAQTPADAYYNEHFSSSSSSISSQVMVGETPSQSYGRNILRSDADWWNEDGGPGGSGGGNNSGVSVDTPVGEGIAIMLSFLLGYTLFCFYRSKKRMEISKQ